MFQELMNSGKYRNESDLYRAAIASFCREKQGNRIADERKAELQECARMSANEVSEMVQDIINQQLQYRIINQGIGGYVYDKNSLMKMPGYTPDKIIVSLGTNQYGTETMKPIEEYYERLIEVYGTKIPILCITPIWRGDSVDGQPVMAAFCEKIKEICRKYGNVTIIEGFRLVPHLSEYYRDNLHPNELGAVLYGRNLAAEIKKLLW